MATSRSKSEATTEDVVEQVGGAPDALASLAYGTASTSEVTGNGPAYVAQPDAGSGLPDPKGAEAVDMGGDVRAQVKAYAFRAVVDGRIRTAPRGRVVKASADDVDRAVALGVLVKL